MLADKLQHSKLTGDTTEFMDIYDMVNIIWWELKDLVRKRYSVHLIGCISKW